MLLLLDYNRINNNDYLEYFFFPSSRLGYYMKHRSFSINMHWPEDMVAVELDIRGNVDLNREGAQRGQSEREMQRRDCRLCKIITDLT